MLAGTMLSESTVGSQLASETSDLTRGELGITRIVAVVHIVVCTIFLVSNAWSSVKRVLTDGVFTGGIRASIRFNSGASVGRTLLGGGIVYMITRGTTASLESVV